MRKFSLILLLPLLFLQSCSSDEPEDYYDDLSFTPPYLFRFDVVDKSNGENVFANGTYEPTQIEITNMHNDSALEHRFISKDGFNLIQIETLEWKTGIYNLKFQLSDTHILNLYIDIEKASTDCCSETYYKEVTISESEFELDSQTGIYKILIE